MRRDSEDSREPRRESACGSEGRRSLTRGRPGVWAVALVLVGVLACSALLAACSSDSGGGGAPTGTQESASEGMGLVGSLNTVTVSANATLATAPDEAVLTISVENKGTDAVEALDTNSENTKRVLERLKTEGVEDSAIETAGVTVYPNYRWDPQTGEESLDGYRARNTVTVTMKDPLVVGKVLASAVESGATGVSGPVWKLSDENQAAAEATKMAVLNAKAKAEAAVAAGGAELGDMLTIGMVDVYVPDVYSLSEMSVARGAEDKAVMEPPLPPGSVNVIASVMVTYGLRR